MKLLSKMAAVAAMLTLSVQAVADDATIPCIKTKPPMGTQNSASDVVSISGFKPASPVTKVTPRYPREAAQQRHEGWVQISYVINEEGNVQDPVVDDAVGDRDFRRYALNALKKWKFDPAQKDGQPTQQCHQKVQFDFALEGVRGASRDFVDRYDNINALIGNGELDTASTRLSMLHARKTGNRYEHAWLWNLDARLARQLGDQHRERTALHRAMASNASTDARYPVFDTEHRVFMLQRLFILNADQGNYANALEYADRLSEIEGQQDSVEKIRPAVDKIKAFIASSDTIFVALTLDKEGKAFHTLVRSRFAFTDIADELRAVEVRCDAHREKFTVAEEHIWQIPSSWGECRVLIEGTADASFYLVEVADKASDA